MFSWLRRKLHLDVIETTTIQTDLTTQALADQLNDLRTRLGEIDAQITTMASGPGTLIPPGVLHK